MRLRAVVTAITIAVAPVLSLPEAAVAADPDVLPAPRFTPGDTWVIDRTVESGKSGFAHTILVARIERVGSDSLVMGLKPEGAPGDFEDHMMGLDLSDRRIIDGQSVTTSRPLAFPLKIGNTWEEDFLDPRRQGNQISSHVQRHFKVVGWEDIVVPAGAFHALKIEANGKLTAQLSLPATAVSAAAASSGGATSVAHAEPARNVVATALTYKLVYYVPSIKTWVKTVDEQYNSENVRTKRETSVLVSFVAGH